MRLSRVVAFGVAAVLLLTAQTPEERRRFQDIQARRNRGETISAEDVEFARRMIAMRDQQQRQGWAETHPPREYTGMIPLPDLGSNLYQGEQGGLYPGGTNTMPGTHLASGRKAAEAIAPLDSEGRRASDGKIVLLSIGMSNATQEFEVFQKKAAADSQLNRRLLLVDGAQGGQVARITADPAANFWKVVDHRLSSAGASTKQVQAVWLKQANPQPSEGFPTEARKLQADLIATIHNLHDRFPNLKVVYLSSRVYGGYATSPLNPEPYAYEGGFAVKWTIADQIAGKPELNFDPAKGAVRAPWLAWGPYLWSDGTKGRKTDNLVWLQEDLVEADRTHPSASGREKVADLLLRFFKTEPTASGWFLEKTRN